MASSSNSVSSNLEKSLHKLLVNYSLEEILFVLYCYAHEQAKIAGYQNIYSKKIDWKKLIDLLDKACNLIEEADEDTEKDNFYLIY